MNYSHAKINKECWTGPQQKTISTLKLLNRESLQHRQSSASCSLSLADSSVVHCAESIVLLFPFHSPHPSHFPLSLPASPLPFPTPSFYHPLLSLPASPLPSPPPFSISPFSLSLFPSCPLLLDVSPSPFRFPPQNSILLRFIPIFSPANFSRK